MKAKKGDLRADGYRFWSRNTKAGSEIWLSPIAFANAEASVKCYRAKKRGMRPPRPPRIITPFTGSNAMKQEIKLFEGVVGSPAVAKRYGLSARVVRDIWDGLI